MASVEYDTRYFEEFVGISVDEAEKLLPQLGFPVEFSFDSSGNKKIIIDITPNRPDLLSIVGLKRLVRNFLSDYESVSKIQHNISVINNEDYQVFVDKNTLGIRNFIACLVIKDISLNSDLFNELIQFQEKLHLTFGRKRKKIAIGLHDLSKVKFPVFFRAYELEKKSFVPLNETKSLTLKQILTEIDKGKEYMHLVMDNKGVIVEDSEGVLAFPPIINAAKTTVTENTKGLFIDVTGTNLYAVEKTIDMFAYLFNDLNAKIYSVVVSYPRDERNLEKVVYPNLSYSEIEIPDSSLVKRYLGINLENKEIKEYLMRMGYSVNGNKVIVPDYRVDVLSYHDLLEDIAIVYGYNNIEKVEPSLFTVGNLITFEDDLHDLMISLGFSEVLTWVLGNEEKYSLFYKGEYAKMINSLTTEYSLVRPLIFPGILDVFARNKTFRLPQKLYEIGQVAVKKEGKLICEDHLAFCIMDKKVNVNQMIAYLNGLFYDLNIDYEIANSKDSQGFIDGRVGDVIYIQKNVNHSENSVDENRVIGKVGELHPSVLEKFSIPFPVVVCEIDLRLIKQKLERTKH
ncbi:MAG: phenylalanine--tRNA ligase subunit beta [Candidatus Micrarchaeota archaeon]|nr:phenylalanine--tRNA ligase subunit beta [Candidatus Micrarchaeota archaeon]